MSKLKVLDLFSGIGGFSLGLERTGAFETVAFCEIDEAARKVLGKHWPEVYVYDDVKNLKAINGEYDVICGGFPCQDISIAGNKKGLKGERSGLWWEFKRLIKEIKPRYAIIENVANLRSNGLQEVLKDLWSIGYASEWHIISARSVGACHLRERIWIIAYPSSEGIQGRNKRGSDSKGLQQETRLQSSSEGVSRDIERNIHSSNTDSTELRKQSGGSSGPNRESKTFSGEHGQERTANPSNSHNFRLWKPFASEEEKSIWWSEATSSLRPVFGQIYEVEPTIHRDDDGFSAKLDRPRKERIKQLGNAVVPQIPELIGRAIAEHEGLI